MNRIVSVALALIMAAGSLADLHDLSKIALLINHYHQAHEQTSLGDFLELHYGAGAARHDKEHGHKSLPFKSHECAYSHPVTVAIPFHLALLPETPSDRFLESPYRSVFHSEFSASIWQPPRITAHV